MEQELADIDILRKKQFCLEQLKPYLIGETPWGYNKEKSECLYFNKESGAMCIAGKCMINPGRFNSLGEIRRVLKANTQQQVFKPENVDVLTTDEWISLQSIHDKMADMSLNNEYKYTEDMIKEHVRDLNLFTYEEMISLKN